MKFRKLAIFLAAVMTLSGCSKEDAKTDPSKLPSDAPYCRNIMETDSGYYYNVTRTLSLRYTEKASGNDIFLCAKPECMHDGNEACTATYNNLIVSEPVLYNGYIYFVGRISTKETTGYSLYKAAPDGSSLDKIADIAEEKKPPQYEPCMGLHINFIIHKGYVYVSYVIGCPSAIDFIQSGLAKVNIQTGETELIFSHDDFVKSSEYSVYAGSGDYVFYNVVESSGSGDAPENYRYNIKTGESERVISEDNSTLTIACFDEKTVYYKYFNRENEVVILKGYDIETLEPNGIEINTGERITRSDILYYEDKFFFWGDKDIKILSKEGELLGKFSDTPVENYIYSSNDIFDISDNKLYISVSLAGDEMCSESSEIYCCNIDDILSGNAKWKKAYTKNSWSEYWDEDPIMKSLQTEEGE